MTYSIHVSGDGVSQVFVTDSPREAVAFVGEVRRDYGAELHSVLVWHESGCSAPSAMQCDDALCAVHVCPTYGAYLVTTRGFRRPMGRSAHVDSRGILVMTLRTPHAVYECTVPDCDGEGCDVHGCDWL